MKKIRFFRNEEIYTPANGYTAEDIAKESISQLEGVSDGEIVLARYRESQDDDIKTMVCAYYDDSEDNGWTFLTDLDLSDYYTKSEIDDEEMVIAQALSDLDERVSNAGTITGITMNGVRMGTSGIVNLGNVITYHQSLSDYATSANYDSVTGKIYLKHGNAILSEINISELTRTPYVSVSSATSPQTIEPYKMYDLGTVSGTVVIQFDTTKEISGMTKEYIIRFVAGSNCNITLPNGVMYSNGSVPTYVSGRTYEINVVNGCAVVGEFF